MSNWKTASSITSIRARAILTDATVIANTIDAALDDSDLAGWPTQCPGAAAPGAAAPMEGWCDEISTYADGLPHPCGLPLPCPNHPTPASSIVERTAGTDRARRDLEDLHEHIRKAAHHLRRAAKISVARGTPKLDKTTIGQKLFEAMKDIYCEHCSTVGQRNVKAPSSNLCEFCREFRTKWKRLPSRRIFDMRDARGGQIYPNDINRIHREDKQAADAAKAEQKRLAKEEARERKAQEQKAS